MKKLSFRAIVALATPVFFLLGCETRSISDSGYRGRFAWESGNRYYRGELNEMDVLGTPAGQKVAEADIRKAVAAGGFVHVHPGDSLLVIQSGAIAPDGVMVDALTRLGYRVQGFSGLPPEDNNRAEYSRKLRLAAAQGGLNHILCYWGTLESAHENQITKTVSWVPIAGSLIPDQTQRMGINVRAALIDVATGKRRKQAAPANYPALGRSMACRTETLGQSIALGHSRERPVSHPFLPNTS